MNKKTIRLQRFGAVAGMAALLIGLQTSAASARGGYYFKNLNSQKTLEIGGWSTGNGASVNQWDLHGGANQEWTAYSYTTGKWDYIKNINSGKCLEIGGWRTDNGAPANQWDCHGGANQQWELYYISDYVMVIKNRNSGKCLEIAGGRKDNGAPARQWDCHGGLNQQWVME
ncbi:RICIN domain-containing protein [Streptosporangium sp. NPDC051023]|uniref:RICIN domain-containing protein n=1 Tax=Streptosporangium sp. NPDC051023 TaxID=3155410 RepID=UPI0034510B0F